jgi:hypothetical protein
MPHFGSSALLALSLTATTILLSGCIVSGNGGKVWLSDTCDFLCSETVINATNRVEYVKVTGTLTFDGLPVVYDELIRFSYATGTFRDGRQPPPIWAPVLNRERILKPVGKGVLSLRVLIPKDRETYVWDGSAAALETVGIWPDVPLLKFSWIEDTTAPRILETYETASYFQRPDSRIKVTAPLHFSRVEPTPEIAAQSEAQAKATPVSPQLWSRFGAPVALYPVPRKIWSKAPEVAAFIATHATTEQAILLDQDLTQSLAYWNPGLNLSDAVPVHCSAAGSRCTPLLADRGYSLAYAQRPLKYKSNQLQIDFGRGIIPLAPRESIYDPQTETLYLAPQSW